VSHFPDDRGAELRTLFFESAGELVQSLNEAGLQLESRPADESVIRQVRRVVHTLKGDSAACGYYQLSELAHELEDVLSAEIGKTRSAQMAEAVLEAADIFAAMLAAFKRDMEPPAADSLRVMIRDLLSAPATTVPPSAAAESELVARFDWTEYEQLMISEAAHRGEIVYNIALRIDPKSPMRAAAFQLVRNVLHGCGTVIALRPEDNSAASTAEFVEAALASTQTQELIAQRCRIPAIVSDLRIERAATLHSPEHELLGEFLDAHAAGAPSQAGELSAEVETPRTTPATPASVVENTLRVDATRIDAAMNLVGELIIGRSMLTRALVEFDQRYPRDPLRAKLSDALSFQSRVLDELHKCVLKIRMVPVEQLFRRFPRVVRDVAKQCNKDVALEVSGQNTDLDKSILDALGEPLMHLVRNAVDHGVERADERIATGKPARGTIFLNSYHQGTQVVIEVRDDGRGLDPAKLRAHAVRKGILNEEQAERLTDTEAFNLIFEPGFSTAREVTEVSGRGVGMDVVRTVLDRLKGTVHISSSKGSGTTIQLRAPLTLASIQTLLFRVSGRLFAVPLSSVVEITRVNENEIHHVDRREVLRLREQVLTLVRLGNLSRIHAVPLDSENKKKRSFVVVIGAAEKRFGLVVDSLVGEEELVIKALPSEIVSSDLVSGASILGDGTVVLILSVPAVLSRMSRSQPLEAIA
jgi:two-component system chemotaxis sensor kinase CheA